MQCNVSFITLMCSEFKMCDWMTATLCACLVEVTENTSDSKAE